MAPVQYKLLCGKAAWYASCLLFKNSQPAPPLNVRGAALDHLRRLAVSR
jgi:hypothetical protein